jgi:hypothetical protein
VKSILIINEVWFGSKVRVVETDEDVAGVDALRWMLMILLIHAEDVILYTI